MYGTALNDLQKKVKKMTSEYDPDNTNKALKTDGTPVPIGEMVKRIASRNEKILYYFAVFMSILTGVAGVGFSFVFGSMIDNVGQSPDLSEEELRKIAKAQIQKAQDEAWDNMRSSAARMLYVGAYTFVTWLVMVYGLNYVAAKVSYRIKIEYFKKCLEKDAAFYDLNNPMEMAAKISKESSIIGSGMGQKVGHVM